MVCGAVLLAGGAAFIPIEKDNHARFWRFTAIHPLTVGFEPIYTKVHTAVASGHGCGAQRPLCGLTATPI